MEYKCIYSSPIGNIILNSDGENLTGLYFADFYKNKPTFKFNNNEDNLNDNLEIFKITKKWLDIYFSGNNPNFTPKFKINNITPFRQEVVNEMLKIPFGQVITYNDLAKSIAIKHNIKRMSCQAVGGAVGSNPICIIIPCHRVVGSNGSLTGYGGGLHNKLHLLEIEHIDTKKFTMPKVSRFL